MPRLTPTAAPARRLHRSAGALLAAAGSTLALAPTVAVAGQCSGHHPHRHPQRQATATVTPAPPANPVELAAASDDFSTLVIAVTTAGLVDTLATDEPLTVFAPTNAAFDTLPHGTLDGLLEPRSRADLIAVLGYHVVPGAYSATELAELGAVRTLSGEVLRFRSTRDGLEAGGVPIATADVAAGPSVVHVLAEGVLLPDAD